jgi:cytochrome c
MALAGAVIGQTAFPASSPDPAAGKLLFERRCSGCHALDADKEGPRLRGVLGRKAGSVASFPYSDALRQSKLVWDGALLEKWLENPDALVPENNMEFRVTDPQERGALRAFLESAIRK